MHKSSVRPAGPISAPQLGEEGVWFASGHALVLTHDQGESGRLLPCEGSQVELQARSCSSMAGPEGCQPPPHPVPGEQRLQRLISGAGRLGWRHRAQSRRLLFTPRSLAKSQGSGKEQGAELQFLSHLGPANKTTPGHLPFPEGCRDFPQMPVSLDFLRRTPGEGA